jgi:hypothetical protein
VTLWSLRAKGAGTRTFQPYGYTLEALFTGTADLSSAEHGSVDGGARSFQNCPGVWSQLVKSATSWPWTGQKPT